MVKDIKSRVKGLSEDSSPSIHRLKIITITEKPVKWTGKTWASEQGYLKSKGSILLFTDGDIYYHRKDAISLTLSYMQGQNLDILTGIRSKYLDLISDKKFLQ